MKLRHFNIMRLLYCLVLVLPFVAILSRVIYVQSNKNAYQSYYGETINEETINNKNSLSDLVVNDYYYLTTAKPITNSGEIGFSSNKIYFDEVEVITNTSQLDLTNTRSVGFYQSGSYILYYFYDDNNTSIGTINSNDYIATLYIKYVSNNLPTTTNLLTNSNAVYTITYNSNSYLDNVFEYSVNKFIDDNNFGRVNLFQWTTNLFFDDNQVNNMYVHFVNWYLNYVLLMSTTYILFLVLMWFVNYSRRLLERGMNYDW